MVLKEIIFHSLYLFWEGVLFLKEMIFNILYFGILTGVVVLKELIFNSLYFERCEGHERMILTLGGCGGHERTHFNCFYFGRMWWS